MRRMLTALSLLGLIITIPLAYAQALPGAIIGGAVGGRRGAVVGAATGAAVGAHRRHHWRNHYFWRRGRCWVQTNGRSHPVANRYCR